MILLKQHILEAIKNGDIVIDGMKPDAVKVNSVDLHLSPYIITLGDKIEEILDVRFPPNLTYKEIGAEGMILYPRRVYLGSTIERTFTPKHVPIMHGKSGVGRYGISAHDAGFGDIGFAGHWTLELTVKQAIRVYAGMPICQLEFQEPKSLPSELYADIEGSSYTDAWCDPKPQPSKLWMKLRGQENPQP
jgi:dCTP deaminase